MRQRPIVLVAVRYYLPGFRSGGPVRSLANLIERLGDVYDFRVVCLDRDFLQTGRYEDIGAGDWQVRGKAAVLYVGPGTVGFRRWRDILQYISPQLVYLNSFLDPHFSIVPLIVSGLGAKTPVLVAPRGELSPGALTLKRIKKRCYFLFASIVGLYKHVYWHACSRAEVDDILKQFPGAGRNIALATNLSTVASASALPARKEAGRLRIVFLSRIAPKKNLLAAIALVGRLGFPVTFDIWGPIDDPAYWLKCQEAIGRCPANVVLSYRGECTNERVPEVLGAADVFYLPTLGENFGHAIFEALSCGLPVVISDQTPWRELQKAGVGADIPLLDEPGFAQALSAYAAMDEGAFSEVRENCRRFARRWLEDNEATADYHRMFNMAMRLGQ